MGLGSTTLLAAVGILVALLWAWAWFGVGATSRRVAMRLELSGGSVMGEMSRVVWPLMPFLSLTWFVAADIVGREASGFDVVGPCALLVALLAIMVLVAIRSLYLGGLPEWAYPGWMARRYYAAHPTKRDRELGGAPAGLA